MTTLKDNLERVKADIAACAEKYGRNPADVKLLAVSKTFPASDVAEAYAAGQIMFGENRVQELETKAPLLPQDIKWHLIGHLQSNKAAKACEFACMIHSVDSEKLIAKLNANAKNSALSLEILLELNVTGEESKAGLRLEKDIFHLAGIAAASDSLRFAGLMTMAEADADEKRLRQTFAALRIWRDRLENEFKIQLPVLSMGMSHDYPQAIAEGATIVRVGTAVFGGRDYSQNVK